MRVLATIYPFTRKLKKILSYEKINVKEGEDEYRVYIFHKLKKYINSLTPIFYLHGGGEWRLKLGLNRKDKYAQNRRN